MDCGILVARTSDFSIVGCAVKDQMVFLSGLQQVISKGVLVDDNHHLRSRQKYQKSINMGGLQTKAIVEGSS